MSHYTRAPPGAHHHLYLHVAHQKHPSSSPHPRRNRNWDPDPLDVISVTSSSDSPPPPPPRRSARKNKMQTPQFMPHIFVQSLPPGARKSGYAPVKQRPRTSNRRSSGKGKARAGDNSGSNELMHVLQNAFESNWYGPGSMNTSPKERMRTRTRTKKNSAKEVVAVDDDEDEEEREQEKQKQTANLPTSLDQALATAFSLNSASPNVTSIASTSA